MPYSKNRTEQNRTEQNRTEQNRTEQNRTEQNRTEQNRTEQNRTEQIIQVFTCADLVISEPQSEMVASNRVQQAAS